MIPGGAAPRACGWSARVSCAAAIRASGQGGRGDGHGERVNTAMQNVSRAKARFLRAADAVAPLACVREHPLRSVGCSFLLGVALSLLRRGSGGLALLPLVFQATELAARLGLFARPETRESADN